MEVGLVRGETLAIDGTTVQARAAVKSLERIGQVLSLEMESDPDETAETRDDEDDSDPPAPRQAGDEDFHGEKFSNRTHRSRTDPDARLFRKGLGKEAKLSFLAHYVADTPSRVILAAEATLATG